MSLPPGSEFDSSLRASGPKCRVPNCRAVLPNTSFYTKARTCALHQRSEALEINGKLFRFCQQCARIHELDRFDGNKRGCRARLASHNRRRKARKELRTTVKPESEEDSPDDPAAEPTADPSRSSEDEEKLVSTAVSSPVPDTSTECDSDMRDDEARSDHQESTEPNLSDDVAILSKATAIARVPVQHEPNLATDVELLSEATVTASEELPKQVTLPNDVLLLDQTTANGNHSTNDHRNFFKDVPLLVSEPLANSNPLEQDSELASPEEECYDILTCLEVVNPEGDKPDVLIAEDAATLRDLVKRQRPYSDESDVSSERSEEETLVSIVRGRPSGFQIRKRRKSTDSGSSNSCFNPGPKTKKKDMSNSFPELIRLLEKAADVPCGRASKAADIDVGTLIEMKLEELSSTTKQFRHAGEEQSATQHRA